MHSQAAGWLWAGRRAQKAVPRLPRHSHPREETDAVRQTRDKQAQVDVVVRKLREWMELALLDSD